MTLNSAPRLMFFCCGFLALCLLSSQEVMAEPLTKDRVDTFQLKSITKKRRHEFTPQFAITLNDPFVQTLTFGLRYAYHISEGISFELSGSFAYASTTGLVEQLRTSGANSLLRPVDGKTPTDEFNPAVVLPQVFASGVLTWTPLVGKFSVGSAVVDTSVYLLAGGGYVMTNRANRLFHLPTINFGIGWRVFLSKWLSFVVDLRDVVYSQEIRGSNVLLHNVFLNIGFGLLLPGEPNYG